MTQAILPLLDKIGEIDVRFKCASQLPNEAYFPGIKTSCVNEFELTVILTNLVTAKTFEYAAVQDTNLSCYGRVMPQQAPHPLGDVLVEKGSSLGYLSAERVRQTFSRLMSQAASLLQNPGITLEVCYKDCLTVVKISRGPDTFIWELVPALIFPDWPTTASGWPEELNDWLNPNDVKHTKEMGFYAQSLPCPSKADDQSLFRISFSSAEKFLLRHTITDSANMTSSRRDPERIFRLIRESDKEDFAPLSSYHIRTILLHACSRCPDPKPWGAEHLGQRFLELLRDVIFALDSHELAHFFIPECNLLKQYSPEVLQAAAARLKGIYQDIYTNPHDSIRLQC